jgi:hypothetical protein
MVRAGVFIGVNQAGSLPALKDAVAGAKRMHAWALQQGMEPSQAVLITDDHDPVDATQIARAINTLQQGAGVDQILVYFAGHGVNLFLNEYWLLSEAPIVPGSVVNVRGSIALAEYSQARYVVLISDACRLPATGLQGQGVESVSMTIFPNDGVGAELRPVDTFYATGLGSSAAEVPDLSLASREFKALYTSALLDGLSGQGDFDLMSNLEGEPGWYVRPKVLADWLKKELPERIRDQGLLGRVNQSPEARIIDREDTWLARLVSKPDRPVRSRSNRNAVVNPADQLSKRLVRLAMRGNIAKLSEGLGEAAELPSLEAQDLSRKVSNLAMPYGPSQMESQCGFKVRGALIASATAVRARVDDRYTGESSPGTALQLWDLERPAVNVVLRFTGGFGTVLPALMGWLTTLSFEGEDLVDVSWEPSANQRSREEGTTQRETVRMMRALVASASRDGSFKLAAADADGWAERLGTLEPIDPALALYSAYGWNELQRVDLIQSLEERQIREWGQSFFDVSLLARNLMDNSISGDEVKVVPFVPLLSQGWALLSAYNVRLHPCLQELQDSMKPSFWSLYTLRGVKLLEQALKNDLA